MKLVDRQTLMHQMKWRYATQRFDANKKISAQDWEALEQAIILAPSSFGLEPWHFVVITSQHVKDQLLQAAFGQQQVSHASHVVVFAVNKNVDAAYVDRFIEKLAATRDVSLHKLEGYRRVIQGTIARQDSATTEAWSARQVYIALGTLLTSAALMGIDACPMEGIAPARVDEILGLNKRGFATLVMATLGYRATDDHAALAAKVRFAASEVVTHID